MFDNNSIRGYIMAWASNSDRVHGLMTDNLGLDRFTYKCAANKGNHWRPLGSKRLWPRDKMGLVTAGNEDADEEEEEEGHCLRLIGKSPRRVRYYRLL